MRVPDDVILLWSDENWGNIRRLPTSTERSRTGGAGIYYHFGALSASIILIYLRLIKVKTLLEGQGITNGAALMPSANITTSLKWPRNTGQINCGLST